MSRLWPALARAAPRSFIALLVQLALLVPASAAAETRPSGKQEFRVLLEGRTVGHASWRWHDAPGAVRFEEEVDLKLLHGGARANASFRQSWQQAQDTITLRKSTLQGRARTHENVRIAIGRDTLMPHALVARLGSLLQEDTLPARLVVLDDASMAARSMEVARCGATEGSRCISVGGTEWQFDAAGKLRSVERRFAGLPLVLSACDGPCAGPVEPLDLLDRLTVRAPLRISPDAAKRKLRYVLSRRDGQAPILVATGDQQVVFDQARAVVTVCQACVPSDVPTDAQLDAYRRPTAWLQSDDPQFRRMAARVGGKSETVDARMRRSVVMVESRLKAVRSLVGYADALQALRLHEADCMGYAVVLAALARAQGIPARIVVGMAYSDRFSGRKDVFTPHAWVQAWNGERWASYDAALGAFDSTHIAFAIGDGDPAEFAEAFGQLDGLQVERVAVVRPD